MLVPKENEADVAEISQEITRGLDIRPVESMEQVLKAALLYKADGKEKQTGE